MNARERRQGEGRKSGSRPGSGPGARAGARTGSGPRGRRPAEAGRAPVDVRALEAVLPLHSPADTALRRFFREHPEMGRRDRALVAETVFDVLRRRPDRQRHRESSAEQYASHADLPWLGVRVSRRPSDRRSPSHHWEGCQAITTRPGP
jgi:hypothetical protein